MIDFDVVIPARYGSNRLPGKPLVDIAGKPLIEHVYRCAAASAASSVIVATDDQRVFDAVSAFGGTACMTSADHNSGTDRIAEVVTQLGLDSQRIVVNLQGDEPMMPGKLIDQVAELLENTPSASMATASEKILDSELLNEPSVVKVVTDQSGMALYFSRAPIPWQKNLKESAENYSAYAQRHIGIYSYRVGFLHRFTGWAPSRYEKIEKLEQLRVLEQGEKIVVCEAIETPGLGVDTPSDLEVVRRMIQSSNRV